MIFLSCSHSSGFFSGRFFLRLGLIDLHGLFCLFGSFFLDRGVHVLAGLIVTIARFALCVLELIVRLDLLVLQLGRISLIRIGLISGLGFFFEGHAVLWNIGHLHARGVG